MFFPNILQKYEGIEQYCHSIKVSDKFIEEILRWHQSVIRLTQPDQIRCLVVGDGGVGKTSLIKTIGEAQKVSGQLGELFEFEEILLANFLKLRDIENVDLVVLVVDCSRGLTSQEKKALDMMGDELPELSKLIVNHKIDQCDREQRDRTRRQVDYYLQRFDQDFKQLWYTERSRNQDEFSWSREDLIAYFSGKSKNRAYYLHKITLKHFLTNIEMIQSEMVEFGVATHLNSKEQGQVGCSRKMSRDLEKIKDEMEILGDETINKYTEICREFTKTMQNLSEKSFFGPERVIRQRYQEMTVGIEDLSSKISAGITDLIDSSAELRGFGHANNYYQDLKPYISPPTLLEAKNTWASILKGLGIDGAIVAGFWGLIRKFPGMPNIEVAAFSILLVYVLNRKLIIKPLREAQNRRIKTWQEESDKKIAELKLQISAYQQMIMDRLKIYGEEKIAEQFSTKPEKVAQQDEYAEIGRLLEELRKEIAREIYVMK